MIASSRLAGDGHGCQGGTWEGMIMAIKKVIKVEFSSEELSVISELGPQEISSRIDDLSYYDTHTQIFSWADYDIRSKLLPTQVKALAELASVMQQSYPTQLFINENCIYRENTRDEMTRTVVRREIYKRGNA